MNLPRLTEPGGRGITSSQLLASQWSTLGHVKFDGVTSGQRATAFVPGLNIGKRDFTVSQVLAVPTTIPAVGVGTVAISTSVSFLAGRTFNTRINAAGRLILYLHGASPDVDFRITQVDNFVGLFGGKIIRLTITRTNGVIAVFADKIQQTLLPETSAGAPPASMGESVVGQYVHLFGPGSNPFNDIGISTDLFNYALTSAQVAELVDFGVTSSNRWAGTYGMNAVANQERNSLFTATATDWAAFATGAAAIDAVNDELDVTVVAAGDGATLALANLTTLKVGQLHKLVFTVRNFATVTSITASFGAQTIGTVAANGDQWLEFTPTASTGALTFVGVSAGSFSISNVRLEQVLLANGSFETAGGGGADVFATWQESTVGTSSVNRDTVITKSGGASLRFDLDASESFAAVHQGNLAAGQLYKFSGWVRHNKGVPVTALQFSIGNGAGYSVAVNIPDLAWTLVEFTFISLGTSYFQLSRAAGGGLASKSLWWDGVSLTPLGDLVSLSPWGLNRDSTLWRNQALTGDATLYGSPIVVTGPGAGWNSAVLAIRTLTASGTLVSADLNKWVQMNAAGATVITIPKNAVTPFSVGAQVFLEQLGVGAVTIAPVDGDVTLQSLGTVFKLAGQFAKATLTQTAVNRWNLSGNIIA